jgi:hypothetical protein
MSPMRLLLVISFFVDYGYTTNDLLYQIQPQLVRINNHDEIYITSDDHNIGQMLYRYDQIQLACECQTELNHSQYQIYWAINNKILNEYNNSNTIQVIIDINTVKAPITYVTCHCVFIPSNITKIKRDYQYQLYIGKIFVDCKTNFFCLKILDLESEPSLKPIDYSVETSVIKLHLEKFIHHHFIIVLSFIFVIIGITCPLIILSFLPTRWALSIKIDY